MNPQKEAVATVINALGLKLTKKEFIAAFDRVMKLVTKLSRETRAELIAKIDARLAQVKDGKDGRDGKDGKSVVGPRGPKGEKGDSIEGPPGRDGSPDTGEDIIAKINEAKGTIKAEAIEGLPSELGAITQRFGNLEKSHGPQTPAKAFRIHTKDASAQCDGANKTFTVGGTHFGIVTVSGTQFPVILRPVVDYTETKTGILLTDAVTAPEEGQSLIITFLK